MLGTLAGGALGSRFKACDGPPYGFIVFDPDCRLADDTSARRRWPRSCSARATSRQAPEAFVRGAGGAAVAACCVIGAGRSCSALRRPENGAPAISWHIVISV